MRPPGVIAILNDVCATVHGVTNTADTDFQKVIKIYPQYFRGLSSLIFDQRKHFFMIF